jgi:hypothetical protein
LLAALDEGLAVQANCAVLPTYLLSVNTCYPPIHVIRIFVVSAHTYYIGQLGFGGPLLGYQRLLLDEQGCGPWPRVLPVIGYIPPSPSLACTRYHHPAGAGGASRRWRNWRNWRNWRIGGTREVVRSTPFLYSVDIAVDIYPFSPDQKY